MPVDAEEVSAAVSYSVSNTMPLTVCGGGHSSSGASSSEGMVVDLRRMRKVDVDATKMTVTFEGGCLWSDIDSALEQFGLATVGGVVNHTGVGGLILGGGHGYLTPLYGLCIDNLLAAEVVVADGSICMASENKNADLFWAIRGAGAQFGVVTRFVSRVYEQGKVWSGTLTFSAEKFSELVAVANELHHRRTLEGHCLAYGIGFSSDGTSRVVSAIPLFHGSEVDGEQYFSRLLSVGPIACDTRMMTTAQMNRLLNPIFEHGTRRLMGSGNVTLPLDVEAVLQTAEMFWQFCEARHGMKKSVIAIELFPTDHIRRVSQDATAYANRGDYYDAMTAFAWENAADDWVVREFNRELCRQIRETNGYQAVPGGHRSSAPVGLYINIEAERISPEDAWGVNLSRLRELKEKYDPRNTFNKWHGFSSG